MGCSYSLPTVVATPHAPACGVRATPSNAFGTPTARAARDSCSSVIRCSGGGSGSESNTTANSVMRKTKAAESSAAFFRGAGNGSNDVEVFVAPPQSTRVNGRRLKLEGGGKGGGGGQGCNTLTVKSETVGLTGAGTNLIAAAAAAADATIATQEDESDTADEGFSSGGGSRTALKPMRAEDAKKSVKDGETSVSSAQQWLQQPSTMSSPRAKYVAKQREAARRIRRDASCKSEKVECANTSGGDGGKKSSVNTGYTTSVMMQSGCGYGGAEKLGDEERWSVTTPAIYADHRLSAARVFTTFPSQPPPPPPHPRGNYDDHLPKMSSPKMRAVPLKMGEMPPVVAPLSDKMIAARARLPPLKIPGKAISDARAKIGGIGGVGEAGFNDNNNNNNRGDGGGGLAAAKPEQRGFFERRPLVLVRNMGH